MAEAIKYDPCLALLLSFDPHPALDFPEYLKVHGEDISSISNQNRSSASNQINLTVNFSSAFSRKHEETARTAEGARQVQDIMLAIVGQFIGSSGLIPVYVDLKRWRYAFVNNPLPLNTVLRLTIPSAAPIYLTGDFTGSSLENCYHQALLTATDLEQRLR